jgi:hypothetical protein
MVTKITSRVWVPSDQLSERANPTVRRSAGAAAGHLAGSSVWFLTCGQHNQPPSARNSTASRAGDQAQMVLCPRRVHLGGGDAGVNESRCQVYLDAFWIGV